MAPRWGIKTNLSSRNRDAAQPHLPHYIQDYKVKDGKKDFESCLGGDDGTWKGGLKPICQAVTGMPHTSHVIF